MEIYKEYILTEEEYNRNLEIVENLTLAIENMHNRLAWYKTALDEARAWAKYYYEVNNECTVSDDMVNWSCDCCET